MRVIKPCELESLVRATFPQKPGFSAEADLGLHLRPGPAIAFVHGGGDPFLDRQLDDWLEGSAAFVAVYPLLNRLCRAGALSPGDYAVTRLPS